MTTKKTRGEAVLAARLAKAYPSLSAYSAATLAEELCHIERAQRRHAERCCSGEVGGYVKRGDRMRWEHDPDAERKAGERIERKVRTWMSSLATIYPGAPAAIPRHPEVTLQGDPRGPVLLLRLPGDADAVGV